MVGHSFNPTVLLPFVLLLAAGTASANPPRKDWIKIGDEAQGPLRTPTLIVSPDGTYDSAELARAFVEYADPLSELRERRKRDHERRRADDESRGARDVRGRSDRADRERDSAIIIRWLTDTIDFVRGFAGGKETWINKDFEASYLQRMKWLWTEEKGWFWVIRVSQTSIWTDQSRVDRRSGGAGFQLPLLGAKSIELRSGQGQLLLRVLPLAGTYRRVYTREQGAVSYDRTDGTRGIGAAEVTPGAELDGSVHWAGEFSRLTTGGRILAQNWVTDDQLFRVIAEVYMRFDLDVNSHWARKMSLVPRCIFEHYREGVEDDWSLAVRGSVAEARSVTRCFMTLEVLVGP